ncbi:MAG: hypothetical protein WCF84_03710 [Anaerolineae bacterium]
MNCQKLLPQLIGAGLILLFVVGCSAPAAAPTQPVAAPTQPVAVPTPIPSTATPIPMPPTTTPLPKPTLPPVIKATPTRQATSVDQLLAQCPSSEKVADINAMLKLSFESDPTVGNFVCTAAKGSADLTLLQRRAYQTLQAMKSLQFSKPLPWTDKSLYDWFVNTIKGIRFRSDIPYSFCCDPRNIINIRIASNTYFLLTDRWIDPQRGGGLMDVVVLYAHEARHNEGYVHTCPMIQNGAPIPNTNDRTVEELGAWGVQYYLLSWLANYGDPAFITDPYYREIARSDSEDIRKTRFCNEPK